MKYTRDAALNAWQMYSMIGVEPSYTEHAWNWYKENVSPNQNYKNAEVMKHIKAARRQWLWSIQGMKNTFNNWRHKNILIK